MRTGELDSNILRRLVVGVFTVFRVRFSADVALAVIGVEVRGVDIGCLAEHFKPGTIDPVLPSKCHFWLCICHVCRDDVVVRHLKTVEDYQNQGGLQLLQLCGNSE